MSLTGISSSTALSIARYQAQAMQNVDLSVSRLASNRRFTSFAEDPVAATKEISLRAQQGSVTMNLRATQNAAAAATAASEGLRSAADILLELRNAVLALDENDTASKNAVQETVTQLTAELTRMSATTTTVDGSLLLDGSIATTGLKFKVASTGGASDEVELKAISLAASALGTGGGLQLGSIDFNNGTAKATALTAIDDARTAVGTSLASTAGVASGMGYHATAIGAQATAIDTAIDNLVGVDVAAETVNLTRHRLQAESAAAMLAQVNALHVSMVRQLLMAI